MESSKGVVPDSEEVTWITVNGSHVPVREGETRGAAIQRHFHGEEKFKGEKSDSEFFREKYKEAKIDAKEEESNIGPKHQALQDAGKRAKGAAMREWAEKKKAESIAKNGSPKPKQRYAWGRPISRQDER